MNEQKVKALHNNYLYQYNVSGESFDNQVSCYSNEEGINKSQIRKEMMLGYMKLLSS